MGKNWTKADLDKSRQARDKMELGVRFWSPKGADKPKYAHNFIRILPPHANMDGQWYYQIPVHFQVGPEGGQRTVGCPRVMAEEPCPICAHARHLINEGHEEAGKNLLPTWSAYVNVVLLDQDGDLADENVYLWSFRTGVLDELLSLFDEHGDLTDPETGRNVDIKRQGTKKKNTKYSVAVAESASPFPGDLDMIDGLIDLTEVTPFLSGPDAKALLAGGAAELGDPWEDGDPEVEAAPEPKALKKGGFANGEEEEEPEEEEEEEAEEPEAEEPEEEEEPHPDGCRCDECKSEAEVRKVAAAEVIDPPKSKKATAAKESEAMKRLQRVTRKTKPKKGKGKKAKDEEE